MTTPPILILKIESKSENIFWFTDMNSEIRIVIVIQNITQYITQLHVGICMNKCICRLKVLTVSNSHSDIIIVLKTFEFISKTPCIQCLCMLVLIIENQFFDIQTSLNASRRVGTKKSTNDSNPEQKQFIILIFWRYIEKNSKQCFKIFNFQQLHSRKLEVHFFNICVNSEFSKFQLSGKMLGTIGIFNRNHIVRLLYKLVCYIMTDHINFLWRIINLVNWNEFQSFANNDRRWSVECISASFFFER